MDFNDRRYSFSYRAGKYGGEVSAHLGEDQIGHLQHESDGFVASVKVHPQHQRRGVATAMLRHLQAQGVNPSVAPPESGNTSMGDAWIKKVNS